ncbi:MAG: hypothetical protein HFF96_04385 [Oscillibacter sp.]|uniref:hypothetical protein n=1 Tax=Oscillibacter sp. TaxID=1945593 RepID=UPI00217490F0|nr:hypothetical protein [Oscillibacter sp.]MCI9113490.1 hypothetical protein [Oscillibacter sp.]
MNPTMQRLFDTYGESVLKDLDRFPHGELVDLLNSLPIKESRRIDLYDRASHYYFQWSADAFVIGLHLGLSLLNDNVRRPRPQKG